MLLTLRQRFIFFICVAVIGFLISGVLGGLIINKFSDSTAAMRIAAVIQSIFQLILPALVTALIVTRKAASFLAIDRSINLPFMLLALCGLIVATPAMNMIISFNEGMHLPQSLSTLEDALREMENNAARSISLLQGNGSIGDLIMNILIIGILAGFGEELFFRGTFMRLMTTGRINHHVAIWTVAVVFSAMHLQFYGFIPRTILGAYFGYLLFWSRCLWIPVIVHASNNIIYVVVQWCYGTRSEELTPIDAIGSDGNWIAVIPSVIATAIVIWLLIRKRVTTPILKS